MKLTGKCNFCGLCCFTSDGKRCDNLELFTGAGMPFATRCKVYGKRYNGMPIVVRDREGKAHFGYVCSKDSEAETKAIVELGLNKGCSLKLKED